MNLQGLIESESSAFSALLEIDLFIFPIFSTYNENFHEKKNKINAVLNISS